MTSNLRIPGPTPVPPRVVAAMQREMVPHRGPAFKALYQSILKMAKAAHRTDGDVFTWSSSGSGGWEAAVVNLLSLGDQVLAVVTGYFGDRFAKVGEAFGLDVRRLDVEWGGAATPELLTEALARHPEVKAVFITHNETSTGVTNPLPELARVVRDHGALVVVDGVSAIGGLPFEMDAWGIDFVLSGSQKAWMCPPGLLIVAAGPRAWDAYAASRFPKFYWDLGAAKEIAAAGMTPTTPSLTLLYAFGAALEMIHEEGLQHVWHRHEALGALTRAGIDELGLALFPDRAYASNTVTAFSVPVGLRASDLVGMMRRDHGIEVAGGQAHLADQIIRIGHMGWAHEPEIRDTLSALSTTLETFAVASAR